MRPKIIHCCWFGGPKTRLARACRASWERFAPDWTIVEWTLADLERLDREGRLPPFAREALAAKKWAVVSDWARMRALADEGGVYLDYDVELVRPFDPPAGEWVAGEWTASGGVWMNPGSGIALAKGSPIAERMLAAYERTAFDPRREMMPWINARLAEAGPLTVLEPEVLSAIDLDGRVHVTDATLGIHHYALSWGGPGRRLLQWMSWHGLRWSVDLLVWLKRTRLADPQARVAAFWEEHCLECAMPLCYGTCPLHERGWHGRCVRLDGFGETVRGCGTLSFRRWGKLELMYHGTMIGLSGARRLERWNGRLHGLWRFLGRYHRAVRWRLAALFGERAAPNEWRLRVRSERPETLGVAIAYEDGREVFRETLSLAAGTERSVAFRIPAVAPGALFRIFPQDGEATGRVEFLENTVGWRSAAESPVSQESPIKCVAWDLDGTLWDGTLSEGDAVRVRPSVVETIKRLDAAGIVNSICSKNDPEPALAQLKALGLEEYFVFPQINWGPKSASLVTLAREMNIGLDALAFVDDRPENRAEVRVNCPLVRVYDETEALGLEARGTGLGSARRLQYRAEMARRGVIARDFAGDAAAFLAQSDLRVELVALAADDESSAVAARCRELVNRTNQLTITARRYTPEMFDALLRTASARAVRVRDKYGDYGIVGFVAWNDRQVLELVVSCRVATKGVERRILEALPKGLSIEVVATDRNAPMRALVAEWLEDRS